MKKLILSIDFDETIVYCKGFPKIDRLRPGAKKYINKLYDQGHYIIINTCRTDNPVIKCFHESEAIEFLKLNGIKYHTINSNNPQVSAFFRTDSRKISADLYVDDKGLWLFGLPCWFILYHMIRFKIKHCKHPLLKIIKR